MLCPSPSPGWAPWKGWGDCTAPTHVQQPSWQGGAAPQVSLDSPGGVSGLASLRWCQQEQNLNYPIIAWWAGSSGSAWVSHELLSAICRARGFAWGAVVCRKNIRREMEIGRERLRAVNNTVGGGKQRIKHTKNCIQTTQMTVIVICKCLPSWKSCHK